MGGSAMDAGCLFFLSRTYSREQLGDWMLYLSGAIFLDMIRAGLIYASLVKNISGKKRQEKQEYIGSAYLLSLFLTISSCLLLYFIYFSFRDIISHSGFKLMFLLAPIFSLTTLISSISTTIAQAEQKFNRIVIIRLLNPLFLFLFLIVNYFIKTNLYIVSLVQNLSYIFCSLFCIALGWSEIQSIFKATKETLIKLYQFGKFSLGTAVGSNLLKSMDVFLIGIFLGRAEVALYSIPLKLVEMINIPLNSFSAVLYPSMAEASHKNKDQHLRNLFYAYTGLISLLFIPFIIILFIFAKQCVFLLGGSEYIQSDISTNILRIFLIYALFLPIDRFSGTSLDCINKPDFTFYKVLIMAAVNTVGDIICLSLFKSLEAVSIVTIVNVIIGSFLGLSFLQKTLGLNIKNMVAVCVRQVKDKHFLHVSE